MNAKTKLAAIALGLMAALANVIHAGLVVFIVSIVFSRCIVAQSGISGAMNHRGDRSNVVFLPLPVDISNYDAQHPDAEVRNRLYHYALNWLRSEELAAAAESPVDLVIVFTDPEGKPILPDLDAARSRFKQSEARLRPTANELTFTFNSPNYPWSAAELTDLQTQLGNYYPTAKAVYGSPAFNITVNLAKDPTISYAGLYFASTNEMIVQSNTRQDAICHEMIHAFRDDDIIYLNSYEEGMTRAAEIEVFDRLPNYTHPWDENHSYLLDIYYEGMNQPEIGSRDGNFFQTNPNTLSFDRYQLAGYAWCKEMFENPQFFVMFNQRYYSAILSDYSIQFTESKLLDLVESVQSSTEGMGLRTWYSKQAVFNASPPAGYFLYQRINQGIYLYRDPSGAETMQANATINWAVYDYQDLLFDSGSGVTGVYGWISFSPNIPESYTGRLKVVTTTMSPAGMVSNVAFRPAGNETGVFGVVLEANSGTVTITSLDSAISPVNANVTNGSFSAPSLTSARGRFRAAFVPTSGPSFFKFFNKDASDYFLLLTPPDLLQLATAVSRKTHGLAGTFDIDLPLNGSPGIECRSTGGAHTLVFTFNNNVTSGNASITAGIGSVSGSPTFAANTMTVNLTGVADIQKITVALDAVRDAFGQTLPNRSVSVNMLSGDTTGNKTVNASDVAQTKVQSGAAVTASNFRTDVTVNGVINASDVNLVKSRSGSALP